mmetsp:Transcript_16070/g.38040  ORF Transcript_16070/g.38040 Transcript_16070/m.38040 type:complete len:305 (-) Transcript_16070:166-1080(-)
MAADAKDLLGDGKLLKQVLRTGEENGDVPRKGDRVTVHYTCHPENDPTLLLDDSRGREEPVSFTVGQGEVILGWEHAIQSMKCGEVASLLVHPEMAFGNAPIAGSGDEARALHFEIELIDVLRAEEGLVCNREDMSPEERLVDAVKAKERGNVHFKAGILRDAASEYLLALDLLGFEDADERAEEAVWSDSVRNESRKKVALACQLNLSQCMLKLEDHQAARLHADGALLLHPGHSKALYRRGLASLGCGLLEQAKQDLREAAKLEPRNAEIRRYLQECQQRMVDEKSNTKDAYGGFLVRSQAS